MSRISSSVTEEEEEKISDQELLKTRANEQRYSCSSSNTSFKGGQLRRVKDSLPWRLWIVAIIGLCERAAFWGLTAPWQNYMENDFILHPNGTQIHGALGLGQVKATRMYCAFYIFYYITPLCIAPLADSWLGQHTALLICASLYCFGCTVLTVSSLPISLINGWGLSGMICAMIFIAFGGGGFKAVIASFIADQYTDDGPRVKVLKSGEQVVTDHHLTLQYIYNLYFWAGNMGSLSWFATVYIEKQYGFSGAYGLTLGFMTISLLLLIFGKPWFVISFHQESILPQATNVLFCAVKEGFVLKRADPEYQFVYRGRTVAWSAGLIDDLAKSLRACRFLLAFVMFFICFDQMQNNLISQAGQMNARGTPIDLLPVMNSVGCIVFGPLIQGGLYPLLHKRHIYIRPVTQIAIGFIFISLAMLYAAFVQHAIYHSMACDHQSLACDVDRPASRPNVWLQAPLYLLISIGEIFAYVSAIEYAYDHSTEQMKVFVQAIVLLIAGLGSSCALAIAQFAHDPNLVWFYASLTAGMATTTMIFWITFRNYDK